MRTVISIAAVGILAVIGIQASVRPVVVESAPSPVVQQGGPVVTIDESQLPLPIKLSGSLAPSGPQVVVAASDLNPYQETRAFNWISSPCNFGGQACELVFSVVPAGKRLIVENISGELVTNAGAPVRTIRLFSATSSWHAPAVLQSTFINSSTHAVNSQLLAHFEAGQVPRVFINTDAINLGFSNEVTISGHFVQLP